METAVIAEKRNLLGKKLTGIRNKDLVPGVIYNSKGESDPIQLTVGEVSKLLLSATKTTVADVKIGDTVRKAIIKEVQRNPVTEAVVHISFFQIDEEHEMVFEIPFVVVGVSPAVKNNIGILVEVNNTLQVRCKLKDLVPSIEVDISKLEAPGQTIQVNDLGLPESLKLFHEEDEDMTIVTVTSVQKLAEAEAAEAAEAAVTTEVSPEEAGTEAEEGASKEEGASSPVDSTKSK